MRLAVPVATCALVTAIAFPARANTKVLVWPSRPGQPWREAERSVAKAGFENVPFAPAAAAMRTYALGDRRELEVLEAAQHSLGDSRLAFVHQRYEQMLAQLKQVEKAALFVLAKPQHRATLWTVYFHVGLAYLSRGGAADEARAESYFRLAVAIDAPRRPATDLWSPRVTEAFAQAAAAAEAIPTRPLALRVRPSDAAVTIDSLPLTHPSRDVAIAPGLHVLHVAAPGYETWAGVIDSVNRRELALSLTPLGGGDPLAAIASQWTSGTLRPSSPSARAAIARAAHALGADAIILLDGDGGFAATPTARLMVGEHVGPSVIGPSDASAVDSALAMLGSDGGLRVTDRGGEVAERRRITSQWWFWVSAGTAFLTAAYLGSRVLQGPDRLRVSVP